MRKVQRLVGDISENDLRDVDYYVSDDLGIFIPSVGYCKYAITPHHTHPAYSFTLFFSKEQAIKPVEIEIPPEHYLVTAMSPEIPHQEEEKDTFTRYLAVLISRELFEGLYAQYRPEPPARYEWEQVAVEREILIYLKRFMSEYENKMPGCDSVLEGLAVVITHQLIRSLLRISVKSDITTERFEIEKAVEYIYQHYGEKISVAGLARMANMSESHFIRNFKKEIGMAPKEFLIKTRIDRAKKLLRSGSRSITEVSLQCGFNSASHFSSSFTKHLGITPSEYQHAYNEQPGRQNY